MVNQFSQVEIYKAVLIKVFVNSKRSQPLQANRQRYHIY